MSRLSGKESNIYFAHTIHVSPQWNSKRKERIRIYEGLYSCIGTQRFCFKSQFFSCFVNKMYLPCCWVVFFVFVRCPGQSNPILASYRCVGLHVAVHGLITIRMRLYKKIQDWIFKSERIREWILRFFTKQINLRSFSRKRCVKGTEESTSRVNSSVPLTHHDPRDIELICLVKAAAR